MVTFLLLGFDWYQIQVEIEARPWYAGYAVKKKSSWRGEIDLHNHFPVVNVFPIVFKLADKELDEGVKLSEGVESLSLLGWVVVD